MALSFGEILILVFLFLGNIIWVWGIVSIVIHEHDLRSKVMWLIILFVTHVVGALIYLMFVRRRLF